MLETLTDEQIDQAQKVLDWLQNSMTQASFDVLEERKRQQDKEGWSAQHDDKHDAGELAIAAVCYASFSNTHPTNGKPPWVWPFADRWWKPVSRRRALVKAAALILAEIERLDRAEIAQSNGAAA